MVRFVYKPAQLCFYMAMALLLFTVETIALYSVWKLDTPWYAVALLHGGIILAMAKWVHIRHRAEQDITLLLLLSLMQAAIGPFGSFTCLVMLMACLFRCHKHSTSFIEWFAVLFPEEGQSDSNILYERIIFGLDKQSDIVTIEPFHDIFAYGTLAQKQIALMKITRYFRPQFAPILLQALQNKEAAIRVQAATVIAKIERDFMKKLLLLEKDLKSDPSNVKKLLSFAKLCDEYAHSGLLDDGSRRKSQEKAINLYEQAILLRPEDSKIKIQLGRLYLLRGAYKEAVSILKQCIDKEGFNSPNVLLWYMEALFYTRAFQEIRLLADMYKLLFNNQEEDNESQEIIRLFKGWNSGIPPEQLFIC